MTLFTHSQIVILRAVRRLHPMRDLVAMMYPHTRDEVVEALDAILRTDTHIEALARVNHVLVLQAAGEPLINGREAASVARPVYSPMF